MAAEDLRARLKARLNGAGGMLEPGNIDLAKRPRVRNPDGSISTISSMGVNFDGREYLLPTISDDGIRLSEDEAIALFQKTGRHLGVFDTPEHATAFARRLSADQGKRLQPQIPTSASNAFKRAAGATFVDDLLGLPDLAVNVVKRGLGGPPIGLFGKPPTDAELVAYYQNQPPIGQRNLVTLTGEQALAGVKALMPGGEGSIPEQYRAQLDQGQQLRAAHPVASSVGDVAGDAATLATGRLPFARKIGEMEKAVAGLRRANLPPGVLNKADEIFKSDAMKALYRGAGRAAETGLEAAALSSLKGGDPLEAAAFGAGLQAGGSGILAVTRYGLKGGPTDIGMKLGAAALAAGSLLQVSKELSPMGQGNIFDVVQSMDEGFSKVAIGLVTGVATAAAGMGRVRGENLPKIADALTALPRGGVLSIVTDMLKEEEAGGDTLRRTVAHLATNPEAFNATQQRRLTAALADGDFSKVVGELVDKDPRFAKLIAADPREGLEEFGEDVADGAADLRDRLKKRLGLAGARPRNEGR